MAANTRLYHADNLGGMVVGSDRYTVRGRYYARNNVTDTVDIVCACYSDVVARYRGSRHMVDAVAKPRRSRHMEDWYRNACACELHRRDLAAGTCEWSINIEAHISKVRKREKGKGKRPKWKVQYVNEKGMIDYATVLGQSSGDAKKNFIMKYGTARWIPGILLIERVVE